jgi:3',5'-cyclic AMP phosphodiesterase CpdA
MIAVALPALAGCTHQPPAVATPVATAPAAPKAAEASWRFAAISDDRAAVGFGDPHYEPDRGINRAALNRLIARINAEHVDFVIFPGDAVYGEKPPKASATIPQPPPGTFRRELSEWVTLMSALNCPWYFAPGNHETYRAENAQELRDVFTAAGHPMPTNGPPGEEQMVYSFDHRNAHVVALSSDSYGDAHHVQTDWLKGDLAANRQPHVFVMAHEPAFSANGSTEKCLAADAAARDAFWALLTASHADAYFCGHEHVAYRSQPQAGSQVWEIIAGRGGAPAEKPSGATEAQPEQFALVTVDGERVSYQTEDTAGTKLDSF